MIDIISALTTHAEPRGLLLTDNFLLLKSRSLPRILALRAFNAGSRRRDRVFPADPCLNFGFGIFLSLDATRDSCLFK